MLPITPPLRIKLVPPSGIDPLHPVCKTGILPLN